MSDFIRDDQLERLQAIARQENRPVDAVLDDLLTVYSNPGTEYQDAWRRWRNKLYAMARAYWKETGDTERLKLTDGELDEQFWLIDYEGIPRLRSDQSKVNIPDDPIEDFIGMFDDEITDGSITIRETMEAFYRAKYGNPD